MSKNRSTEIHSQNETITGESSYLHAEVLLGLPRDRFHYPNEYGANITTEIYVQAPFGTTVVFGVISFYFDFVPMQLPLLCR